MPRAIRQHGFNLLHLSRVQARTGLSRSQIYRLVYAGTFPTPVKLGERATWSEHEVAAWCEAHTAARDAAMASHRKPQHQDASKSPCLLVERELDEGPGHGPPNGNQLCRSWFQWRYVLRLGWWLAAWATHQYGPVGGWLETILDCCDNKC